MGTDTILRFVPNRVEGLPAVSEVAVFPDRLEVCSAGEWNVIGFEGIARWPRPIYLWKWLARFGKRPTFLPVAERDWFQPQGAKFFTFYTSPCMTVFLPGESGIDYRHSLFRRVQDVMLMGGYHSNDLG